MSGQVVVVNNMAQQPTSSMFQLAIQFGNVTSNGVVLNPTIYNIREGSNHSYSYTTGREFYYVFIQASNPQMGTSQILVRTNDPNYTMQGFAVLPQVNPLVTGTRTTVTIPANILAVLGYTWQCSYVFTPPASTAPF